MQLAFRSVRVLVISGILLSAQTFSAAEDDAIAVIASLHSASLAEAGQELSLEQRVAAHVVRCAPGVGGLALDDELEPPRRRDRRHHCERLAAAVELGTLLDMRFEVAHQLVGPAGGLAVVAVVV